MSIGSPSSVSNQTQSIDHIQADNIIVIHPGSLFLRIGRANQTQPETIYHVIARKNKSNKISAQEQPFLIPTVKVDKDLQKTLMEAQVTVANTLNSCLTSEGKLRSPTSKDKIAEFNKKVEPVVLTNKEKCRSWTQHLTKDIIIGEEALWIKPAEQYHIRWPIRRGQLNVNSGIGGSLTSVIADLESIWSIAIKQHLDIETEHLKNFKAVLIISDVFNRNHIKYLMRLLLENLGFESCIIVLESVCATFGAGLSFACVVDCGDQKTSICCVEDGFSSRYTKLSLDFGGSDITQVFYYFLKQRSFPYSDCHPESRVGGMFLQKLKENCCHLNLDAYGLQEKQFLVENPDQPILSYTFQVGDECLWTPLALFYPELFQITSSNNTRIRILERNEGDPEDPFDENYLIQTKRKYGESNEQNPSGELASGDQNAIDLDELDTQENTTANEKEISIDQQLPGIDQAILQCIDRCDSEEMKRRMYSCILIVGGGSSFHGLEKWLHSRLSMQIPLQYRGQQIDIITKPKDIDPKIVTWKGATLMCLLDTAQEMWIKKSDWTKSSIRILREKASFVI